MVKAVSMGCQVASYPPETGVSGTFKSFCTTGADSELDTRPFSHEAEPNYDERERSQLFHHCPH